MGGVSGENGFERFVYRFVVGDIAFLVHIVKPGIDILCLVEM